MKSVESLLTSLRHSGVTLWVENDQLRYRSPKSTLGPRELEEIRKQKREIINFLEAVRKYAATDQELIIKQVRPKLLPLSYAQDRLWFLDQLGLVGSGYNIPLAVRLEGILDVGALERSLGEVIRRHEVLRTRLAIEDGRGIQVIDEPGGFGLERLDLSDIAEGEREARASRIAGEEGGGQFNLSRGALFRAKLVRLNAEDHVLLVTMHHIVSDGWSLGVLIREVAALYEAFSAGRPSPLPALAIQYADYAIWQRSWLQGEVLAK